MKRLKSSGKLFRTLSDIVGVSVISELRNFIGSEIRMCDMRIHEFQAMMVQSDDEGFKDLQGRVDKLIVRRTALRQILFKVGFILVEADLNFFNTLLLKASLLSFRIRFWWNYIVLRKPHTTIVENY